MRCQPAERSTDYAIPRRPSNSTGWLATKRSCQGSPPSYVEYWRETVCSEAAVRWGGDRAAASGQVGRSGRQSCRQDSPGTTTATAILGILGGGNMPFGCYSQSPYSHRTPTADSAVSGRRGGGSDRQVAASTKFSSYNHRAFGDQGDAMAFLCPWLDLTSGRTSRGCFSDWFYQGIKPTMGRGIAPGSIEFTRSSISDFL
ncbi:hypothetical protein QBC34DRAFT_190095 [Podospora aff. communis PSN243]|uniref:Uncharacterized protein n=1 Tax=Podospora aff. communis PSN243 TaxID=3040156 RepID=A0AAV9H0B9_9PEZI|nr:hypothetical protein QBC34DRAFT_190095 [Podospora aff. communis PSN243]